MAHPLQIRLISIYMKCIQIEYLQWEKKAQLLSWGAHSLMKERDIWNKEPGYSKWVLYDWGSLEQEVSHYLRGLGKASYRKEVLGIPEGQPKKIRLTPIKRRKPMKCFLSREQSSKIYFNLFWLGAGLPPYSVTVVTVNLWLNQFWFPNISTVVVCSRTCLCFFMHLIQSLTSLFSASFDLSEVIRWSEHSPI